MCGSYSCKENLLIGSVRLVLAQVTYETELWLSLSVKQRESHCCGAPLVYQDLSMRHDWPVKQACVDLSIKMKGNSKHTSGSLLEAQSKGYWCCFTDVTNQGSLVSVTQATWCQHYM